MKKRILAILAACLLVLSMLAGCGGDSGKTNEPAAGNETTVSEATGGKTASGDVLIGVAMPTQSLQRWNQDGDNLNKFLTEMGYKVDLQYADNEVQQQVSQIENMITKGAKVLIIAPVDGGSLSSVLQEAKDAGIKVIAQDRFIT